MLQLPTVLGLGLTTVGSQNYLMIVPVARRSSFVPFLPLAMRRDAAALRWQNLHRRPDHPLCIIKEEIYRYMESTAPGVYRTFDDLYPIVTTRVSGRAGMRRIILVICCRGRQCRARLASQRPS